MRSTTIAFAAAGIWAAVSGMAHGQAWPARPISLVVTFAAGGPADGVARMLAAELGEKFGQRIIVENKGGGGGNIGAAAVAKSPADGYTLLMVTQGPGALNRLIYKSLPYDPAKDLTPVVMLAAIPQVVTASMKLPFRTLSEVVAYGKTHRLNIGNSGYGTGGHLSAILFAREAGLEVTHIAYRGVGPLLTDIMSGQIEVGFGGYVPQVQNVKAVAVTSTKRVKALPDVPTTTEAGMPKVVAGIWYGILAPTGTPRDIIDKINGAVNDFFKTPRGRDLTDKLGMQVIGGSPEDMAAYIAQDLERLGPIVKSANITMD